MSATRERVNESVQLQQPDPPYGSGEARRTTPSKACRDLHVLPQTERKLSDDYADFRVRSKVFARGREFLMLALAACYCNDLYREASRCTTRLGKVCPYSRSASPYFMLATSQSPRPNHALNRTRPYVASCLATSVSARRLAWIRYGAVPHGGPTEHSRSPPWRC